MSGLGSVWGANPILVGVTGVFVATAMFELFCEWRARR